MLTFYIKEYCIKKGIKPTPYMLSRMGIPYLTAKSLLSGNAKSIKNDVLELLCARLECNIQDLYAYTPDDKMRLPASHPLYKLHHPKAPISPPDIIKDLSPEKLEKVHAFIDKLRKG